MVPHLGNREYLANAVIAFLVGLTILAASGLLVGLAIIGLAVFNDLRP
jgi:hypothetical protein